MFKFFKKKKKEDGGIKPEQNTEKKALGNIIFHAMPQKFTKATGSSMHHTKKWGLVIVGIGVMVLIASAALLIWYIFKPQISQNTVMQNDSTMEETMDIENEEQKSEQDVNEPADVEFEERDLSEKTCGNTNVFANELIDDYNSDEVLVCLGERLQNGCLRATAVIETSKMGDVRMAVLGLRGDECLVQLTYPSIDNIQDVAFQDYSNSYIRCSYDKNDLIALGYEPARLATYIYEQSTFDQLTENSSCEGTAFSLWEERDERLIESEEGFVSGVDTDQDGLSNVEENTIFATSIDVSDTDEDNYSDSTEILNLYNPAGKGLLKDSGLVSTYNNPVYNYSLLYPKSWRIEDATNGNNVIFFSNLDGFVQIISQTNNEQQTLAQWYADINASVESTNQAVTQTTNGLDVLYSPDGLTAYVLDVNDIDNIYVITYSPERNNKLEFLTTFKMIVNSILGN